MGVVLTLRLDDALTRVGMDPKQVSLGALLDRAGNASVAASLAPLRDSLAGAVQALFIVAFVVTLGAWVVVSLAPRGMIAMRRLPAGGEKDERVAISGK